MTVVVLVLCFTIAPVSATTIAEFLIGAVFLIVGLAIFLLGADVGVSPMGEMMGSSILKSRKLSVIIVLGFIIGFMVTIAEPDVQVLAKQFDQVTSASISNLMFCIIISCGVGIFLVAGILRTLFRVPLSRVLWVCYLVVFAAAAFTSPNFLPVAFDSGGVTTGPMTVPFILALGIGVTRVIGGKRSEEDSFGLVALSSVGPVLAVLIMGIIFRDESGSITIEMHKSDSIIDAFVSILPEVAQQVFVALLPMLVMFVLFQIFALKLPARQVKKILLGLIYTYVGLVLFLTGVEGGFMGAAMEIGSVLASGEYQWALVPIGALLGFLVVFAEPAVRVLTEQVEEVSSGLIGQKSMLVAMSLAVAAAVALAMVRVLVGFSLWWYIIPGYAAALILMKFSPPIFTAIAFDSGGVASGPMTATFILAFAQGAALSTGADILRDAFGVVAMVAMTPLITIQILGVMYQRKLRRAGGNDDEDMDFIGPGEVNEGEIQGASLEAEERYESEPESK
ncbi:DUF1538 domain-containing protein [Oscillospiraceae bacterium OttesenSCG-928-F05]|nr:DUF1538 domain-containing protein [Oscillospiraceae bacterium OttesenSCG-928-F05]